VAAVKEISEVTGALDLSAAYRLMRSEDLAGYRAMLASADAKEGPQAFVEKRPPRWQAR
jgi:crotonobetainyl-CoA hydratase